MKLSRVKLNPDNPRVIKDNKFLKLVNSIINFPQMLEKRRLVCVTDTDKKIFPLGGNMRYKALIEISTMGRDAVLSYLSKFGKEENINLLEPLFKGEIPDLWVELADEWTEEQRKEFIIKDNVSFGEWNFDELANNWDADKLTEWGIDFPNVKNTEILSKLEYKPIYYEPKKMPDIQLIDCVDLTKFNKKIAALDEFNLSKEQKKVLKIFAYRFIKIDFESIANFYYFNASEEEQKAIERLRLVLTDTGLNGFIEDDLLKIMEESLNAEND